MTAKITIVIDLDGARCLGAVAVGPHEALTFGKALAAAQPMLQAWAEVQDEKAKQPAPPTHE